MTAERTFRASQLAAHLGIKSGMVRRYHIAYEAVTDQKLPRDPANNGRLVNDEQLAVLTRARELVRANPMLSVEDAIKSVLGIASVPTTPASPHQDVLEAIALELRALREAQEGLRAENTVLREENAALKEQLKALPPTPSLGDEGRKEDLQVQVADLEQRNRALWGELERRKREAEEEPARRPWWRWWGPR